MTEIIVDAADQILGRVGSRVVKEALKGVTVSIINSEKAVISGDPEHTIREYKVKVVRGDPYHGPFYPKSPERIVKRTVRGMLPYKKTQGMEAFKRIKAYISVPEEFVGKETVKLKHTENNLKDKYITLGDLSLKLGAKKIW
ncbi:MAG: 50S ribosomal protein L13 [Candidatus Aenigmatarchaeota archaeon]